MDQTKIELAYELVDEIKTSEDYKRYLDALNKVETNPEVQRLSKHFKEAEEKYNEAKQYGVHHPDLKQRQRQFQETKKILFEHPDVQDYKVREKTLQQKLDTVASKLASSISKRIKVNYNSGLPQIGGTSCKVEKA